MGSERLMTTEFDDLLCEAQRRPLIGWDLSLEGRITFLAPHWDFEGLVTAAAQVSPDLLDLGTGGGEWLSALPVRPQRTVATEGWPENVPIARKRLEPLGIQVIEVDGAPDNTAPQFDLAQGRLPFPDSSFHLISNRHESYVPSEIVRVLAPGGQFLTQQVASEFNADLLKLLGVQLPLPDVSWDLAFAIGQATEAGLTIKGSGEGWKAIQFSDVGALAWYLKNVPFVFSGFEIETYRSRLAQLHATRTPLNARMSLFWFEAQKAETGSDLRR